MKRKKILVLIAILASIAALSFAGLMLAIVVDGLSDEIQKADVAIVLGNEVKKNGQPSARLQARLQRALDLYREGYVPSIIVSGGVGKSGFDEAEVMADWLVQRQIPRSAIIIDSKGINTFATGRNASLIMGEKKMRSAIAVSQYFHIPRSKMALRRYGIAPVYGAHARFFEWRDLYSTPREVVGYVVYSMKRPG